MPSIGKCEAVFKYAQLVSDIGLFGANMTNVTEIFVDYRVHVAVYIVLDGRVYAAVGFFFGRQ
jgi:hypothetical protein